MPDKPPDKKVVQKVVLGGIVLCDNKLLIIQRSSDEEILPNMWELPSGKKEPLESSEASLVREVAEETGLKVEIIAPIDVFDYQIEKPEEIRDSTQINFLVQPVDSSEVKLSSEHQDFKWIGEKELDSFPVSGKVKISLKKAFSYLSKNTSFHTRRM